MSRYWSLQSRHSIATSSSQLPPSGAIVTLCAGEALFLPRGYFHWVVSETKLDEMMNVAVNRWYSNEPDFCLLCLIGESPDGVDPTIPVLQQEINDTSTSLQQPIKVRLHSETDLLAMDIPNMVQHFKDPDQIVWITRSDDHQFASTLLQDTFPKKCQIVPTSYSSFLAERDPATYYVQGEMKDKEAEIMNELFKDVNITRKYVVQNAWINFARSCESLNHCDAQDNVLLQLSGTKTVRIWKPCFRDLLLMKIPIPARQLCWIMKKAAEDSDKVRVS